MTLSRRDLLLGTAGVAAGVLLVRSLMALRRLRSRHDACLQAGEPARRCACCAGRHS